MPTPTPFPTPTQPPPHPSYTLTPHPRTNPHTLLLTINRPASLNALHSHAHWEAARILQWFDSSPSLRVCVITGAGERAFCAGQDLVEMGRVRGGASEGGRGVGKGDEVPHEAVLQHPPGGFMGMSRRAGRKPLIAAVNGMAFGGGFEIVLNCDMVLACPSASFSLPETRIGLYAAAGGLSRLVHLIGLPLTSEIALAGRTLGASEARDLHIVNRVSETGESLVREALELAERVALRASPDAIIVSKSGIREGLEGGVEGASVRTEERWGGVLQGGENLKEGVAAFVGRRGPQWVDSKL